MRTQVSEIKVSYQEKISASKAYKIQNSKDAARLVFDNWDKKTIELQECFKVLLLNNSHYIYPKYQEQ
ncbi:hypothetical protein N7U66_03235 [Lacinutrix neustonica]|uniref:Uncharacterized protein n=1 Tax=Lacinutrix neustonica TaxID=2980107 RepID=A0A9E8MYQ9_9FLAO|nr:hypothetical protein [Lacinutrix neustonica]WAC02699.1 hypothetical protein N7U66_03235 [Lacinutrix neustonica]